MAPVMSINGLLVPIHLDALVLENEETVLEAMADFSKLPYYDGKGKYDGYELLLRHVHNEDELPQEGNALIIVANVADQLHFRIFDAQKLRVEDKREKELPDCVAKLAALKKDLEGLWKKEALDPLGKDEIVKSVQSILGHTQYDVNADVPYISEKIVSHPFRDQSLRLGPGVHLHWALPDALTQGVSTATGVVFPAVPDRWLVTRSDLNGERQKQWIVESDYLHPENDPEAKPPPGTVSFPLPPRPEEGKWQPYRYLGRKWVVWPAASKEDEKAASEANTQKQEKVSVGRPDDEFGAEYLNTLADEVKEEDKTNWHRVAGAGLTAIGYGEPAFAAFYPNCRSVFGLHDPDITSFAELKEVSYDVIGWYDQPEKRDCLRTRVGYGLKLVSVQDVAEIPGKGKSLVIVAQVNNDQLHFRIFDPQGKRVSDTSEQQLSIKPEELKGLKKELEELWDDKDQDKSKEAGVVAFVTSILGTTFEQTCSAIVQRMRNEYEASGYDHEINSNSQEVWHEALAHHYGWVVSGESGAVQGDGKDNATPAEVPTRCFCYATLTPEVFPTFSMGDLADLPSLVGKLNPPERPVDKWLVKQLSVETNAALKAYQAAGSDRARLQTAILKDLNTLPGGTSIHDDPRLEGVDMRPETQGLVQQNPQGTDLLRLNRLLLEDAYPKEFSRNRHFKPDPAVTSDPVDVAVGNNASEALSAYLAHQDFGDRAIIEEQLEALGLGHRLEHRQLDIGPKFREARHDKGFKSIRSGILYTVHLERIVNASAADPAARDVHAQTTGTLPAYLAHALNDLNTAQLAYQRGNEDIESLRLQIYHDWTLYMQALRPPEGLVSGYPDPVEVARFIEKTGLRPLKRKLAATGGLTVKREKIGE